MPTHHIPRILIAGTSSGCGKTTITCAILKALTDRTLRIAPFKCGPDYIDPMFHSEVTGTAGGNLDSFFADENTLNYLFVDNAQNSDLAVLEGVMGYYDGNALTERNSTYEIAKQTQTPTILTINCKGVGNSVLAILHGFLSWQTNSLIHGVILNNVSDTYYPTLKKTIENHYGGTIKVLGYLPPLPESLQIKSRHLGLITVRELKHRAKLINALGAQAEQTIDLNGLLEIAKSAAPIADLPIDLPAFQQEIVIGVACDNAFCFYYRDNLKLLEKMGARLVYFSPLKNESLPEGLSGLLLGGGYPELYKEKLTANIPLKTALKRALDSGLPCIAECGGFMYLTESIETHEMVGYFSGTCENKKKLTRFGYVTLEAKTDNLLLRKGETLKGHEFHYYDCTNSGIDFEAKKENGRQWSCVHTSPTLYAGYPHLYFYSNLTAVKNFYAACLNYQESRT